MLDLNLVLAIAHHFAVFTMVGLFAVEFALLRRGVEGKRLEQLGRLDASYGAIAGIVVIVGIIRVIFGGSGWEYYVTNWAFWGKMAAFLAIGLSSIPPTMAIIRWRRAGTPPSDSEVDGARRYLRLQAGLFLAVPAFAAAMARGYGTF